MNRKSIVSRYALLFISILGCLILLWFLAIFIQGQFSNQFGIFFIDLQDFWADMLNVVGYSSQLDPYNNLMYTGLQEKAYPPLAYLFTWLYSRFQDMGMFYDMNSFLHLYVLPHFLVPWLLTLLLIMLFYYELIRSGKSGNHGMKVATALVFLFSGPMLYSLERGNIVLLSAMLCLAFVLSYRSDNLVLRELGYICLAMAAGLKLSPAVLGLVLIRERRWRDAVRTVIYGLVFFFVPFLCLKGGFANIPLFLRNLSLNQEAYRHSVGCSIRNLLDCFGALLHVEIPAIAVTIVSLLFAAYFVYIGFTGSTAWLRLLALTLIILVVPTFSHYYNVLYLIPSALLFLNETEHEKIDVIVLVALLLVFSPIVSWITDLGIDWRAGVLLLSLFTVITPLFRAGRKPKSEAAA